MPFIFPGLLVLGILGAVPILIHLLNRQRYRPVKWAAMSFLLASMREDAKKIRYKDMLLMALRTLACLFLVLAVARPITRLFLGNRGTKRSVILVIDTSASMGANSGAATLLDKAKQSALGLVRDLEQGTSIGLIDDGRPAKVIVPRTEDRGVIERAIEELSVNDCGSDIAGALRAAGSVAEDAGYRAGVDMVFVTDLQATAWKSEAEVVAKLIRDFGRGLRAYVAPVEEEMLQNLAITRIELETPWVTQGQPASVVVDVANGGTLPADNIVVDLLVGKQKVSSQVIVTIRPGQTETLNFVVEIQDLGYHVISAAVNGATGRLAVDDVRRTVARVTAGVQTLLVDGEPGQRFGEGEVDYIEALLNPDSGAAAGAQQKAGFSITRVNAEDLTPRSVQDKDIIVLANVATIESPLAAALKQRVADGAGLIVFLGEKVVRENYNQFVEAPAPAKGASQEPAGSLEKVGLLPAAVGGVIQAAEGEGDRQGKNFYLSGDKLQHPWMSVFQSPRNKPLLRSAVFKACALEVNPRSDAHIVAWYENGTPAIVEKKLGDGAVVMVGTTADPKWNEFFREPLGPILVRRIVNALIPGCGVSRQCEVGEPFLLPLSSGDSSAALKLITPDDKIREVKPERVGDRWTFSLQERERSGNYELSVEGSRSRRELFVMNVASAESFLAPLQGADLSSLFPDGEVSMLAGKGATAAGYSFSKARMGRELWRPVMLICLLLFLAEIILARLFTPDAAGERDLPKIALRAIRSTLGMIGATKGVQRR